MNIAIWLQRAARQLPDALAVAFGEASYLTYGEMARRVAGLAGALAEDFGLAPGDRVAIVAKNHPGYLEALFAIWWAGMVAVPINAKLHPAEIAWILEHADATAAFVSPDLESSIGGGSMPNDTQLTSFDSESYERLAGAQPASLVARARTDLAWLFYTSGTTGRPKGAMLSHGNLVAMSLAHVADLDPTSPGDSLIHAAPLSHGSGLLTVPQVMQLGFNVIPESGGFDPYEVATLVNRWKNASLFAAPTMVRRLADSARDLEPDALRTIVWGGAPMHAADTVRALDRFGPRLAQLYGQGESPMTISGLGKTIAGDRMSPHWRERLASAGTARSVVEVRVAGEEDMSCGPDTPGEVLVRGDTVMAGYWRDSAATAATLRNGWLRTGDVGTIDEHGYLFLKDRSKDLIISGGSNVYPREVEEVLASHPGVKEVSVIGRPDPQWGEIVVAYVVGRADATDLDRLCLERIARFKRPKDYAFVSELPKNNYGKVLKTELRKVDSRRRTDTEPPNDRSGNLL